LHMIKKIKIEYLLIALIFIIVPIFLWVIFLRFGTKQEETTSKPTTQFSESTPLRIPSGMPKYEILSVTNTSPLQDTNIAYSPIQPLEFSFNNSVDIKGIKISTTPNTQTVLRNGTYSNKIFIYPKTRWVNGVTRITILPGSVATDGAKLYLPFVYELVTVEPTEPPHEDENY